MSIAPLGSPLVPDVNSSSANVSGSITGSCPAASGAPTWPPTSPSYDVIRSPSIPSEAARTTAAAASVRTTSRAWASFSSVESSGAVYAGLSGTATSPARSAPKYVATNSGVLPKSTATRSPGSPGVPGRRPASTSPATTASTSRSSAAQVSVRAPATIAGCSGRVRAAARTKSATVRGESAGSVRGLGRGLIGHVLDPPTPLGSGHGARPPIPEVLGGTR